MLTTSIVAISTSFSSNFNAYNFKIKSKFVFILYSTLSLSNWPKWLLRTNSSMESIMRSILETISNLIDAQNMISEKTWAQNTNCCIVWRLAQAQGATSNGEKVQVQG
jgi:hypothetical protein